MYTLNAVKLRNEIHALNPDLKVALKNVRINGVLQGCSGFITDENTGRVVYVSTDRNHGTNSRAFYRSARDERDFHGGTNHFADFDSLAAHVVAFIERVDAPFALV